MIGIVSATAAGDSLPVAAAGAPTAATAAADQRFDDVFRHLTGALLGTASGAGKGRGAAGVGPTVEAGDDEKADHERPIGAVVVPMMLAVPADSLPAAAPALGEATEAGIDGEAAAMAAGAADDTAPAARRLTARGGRTHGTSDGRTSGTSDGSARGAATAPLGGPLHQGGAAGNEPVEETGPQTPSTAVEANVRGLDRRRGMRETPARARTFEAAGPVAAAAEPDTAAGAEPAEPADARRLVVLGTAPAAAAASASSATLAATPPAAASAGRARTAAAPLTAPVTLPAAVLEAPPRLHIDAPATEATPASPAAAPATADRAFALLRALARQDGAGARETRAAGETAETSSSSVPASAGQSGPVPVPSGGTGHESDGPGADRRQARHSNPAASTGTPVTGASSAAAGQGGVVGSETGPTSGDAAPAGSAAAAAWRTAFASTAHADALGPTAEAARAPGAPALAATVLAAFDMPVVRDRGPLVDTVLPSPELDHATAESVQAQIVKSIRLQWSGGSSEARVLLKPEFLGEVAATIKVDQGVVTATLHADTPEVRRWMESHTATLRDALVEHGLKLERLTVAEPERQEAQGERHARPRQRQQDSHRPRARRQNADPDSPFDVTTE